MDALDRLHGRLIDAVRRASAETRDHSLTIADIYQHLVPYRLIRAELGFSELKEYEHALLRLLSGEREYVQVDLVQVAEEFRRELRSPNPILGIYRDYAAVGVKLGSGEEAQGGEPPENGGQPEEAPKPARKKEPEEVVAEAAPAAPAASPAKSPRTGRSSEKQEEPRAVVEAGACWSCRQVLPSNREVRFCPQCGMNQALVPCAACRTPLEPQWRFCVECGVPTGAAAGEPVAT